MKAWFLVLMFVLGACMGSFLCCQARRLRLREVGGKKMNSASGGGGKKRHRSSSRKRERLNLDDDEGESLDSSSKGREYPKSLGSRSVCLHCGKQIKWYDNIPLVSWLILRGKCRFCHRKIGLLEPLSELGMALAFLLLSLNFNFMNDEPLNWVILVILLIFACLIGFLAIYDGAYSELPTVALIASIVCAVGLAIARQAQVVMVSGWDPSFLITTLGSVAILGGTYLVLYLVSKGNWVGDGDWLLGIALGTALANPWLALIALCLANLFACLLTLPRYKKKMKIPLGPFLIVAFVVTYSFQNFFLNLL